MSSEREDRLRRLCEALRELTSGQVGWVEAVVQQFRRPAEFRRLPASETAGQKGSYKSRSWQKPTALSMLSGFLKLAS